MYPIPPTILRCLWYCKSTIFQANHNRNEHPYTLSTDVCDTAKVRFFKQITTKLGHMRMYAWCLWYCKSTIFQANHNCNSKGVDIVNDVCDTAKVRFFKQITTLAEQRQRGQRCLWYCKSTIFQANHNLWLMTMSLFQMFVILQKYDFSSKSQHIHNYGTHLTDVCDTAKVRFFKQITTYLHNPPRYARCLWYCKSTIFQANHNWACWESRL